MSQVTDVRHDLSKIEKEFDVASSQFTKDGAPVMASIDAEVAALAAHDYKSVVITPEENKRLYRLIVKRVLVVMLGTYFLQSLDKGTMSFAAIMNIREDTGMKGQEYAWLTTILYLGILVAEYPISRIVQRFPVGKVLAAAVFCWGGAVAVTAACHNWAGLMVCRYLLGTFECAVQPCLLVIGSMWFTRAEQTQTISYWYAMTGIQQAVGGLMSFGVSHLKNAPIKSWQVLFIALGCLTLFWAVFVWFWLPDSPMRAKCFSEDDRLLLLERVRANQTGVQNKKYKMDQIVDALKDPQVWALCMSQILNTVPTGGYGAFGNLIIKAFGFDTLQTSLLSIAQGAVHIVIVTSCAYIATRFKQRILVALGCLVPMVAATVVLMTVNTTPGTRAGLLIAFYSGFFFNGQAVMIFSLISSNFGGQTKKTFSIALTFVAWCAGNMIGPQVFQAKDAPRYRTGFAVHLGFYGAQAILLTTLRFYYLRQNAKKKAARIEKYGEAAEAEENLDNAFDDLTDRQNIHFRYMI